jgi:RING finger and CHY zinc finger domain-containing protein 1
VDVSGELIIYPKKVVGPAFDCLTHTDFLSCQAKKPFHCEQCGFCRVGGMESFRHCEQCCMCISVSVFEKHQCFKDKYKNNCPVCREDMFSSRQSPQDLPCGHAIHAHCFRKLAGFDYRCPICKKTVVSQASMAAAWEARARDIAEHAMPPDLQRIVDIMCNDCEVKSHNRQWHFLGIQCPNCNSFNTVVENVVSTAADQMTQQGQSQEPPPNLGG